ncbi:4Fe-4S binding protein [Desulfocurvus sp.]|uniref:ATP-binding protein n=1 Tax=Desulfocurvus sp. TaxID=2871698 RepID=UPI0025C03076|nr:4Fe-4S binding protein [Desulfocurvus sp.]MCK9239507.1 4Fe-4S binding protein [Desulfocurvus sp.]
MTREYRKIIEIDEELCNGCGQCVPSCAEGALAIVDGKARVVRDSFCDGLGACLGECPTGALRIVEREAEPFDEAAALAHVAAGGGAPAHGHAPGGGCPGAAAMSLRPGGGCPGAAPARLAPAASAGADDAPPSLLGHWPVQIRLVPPDAPFLRGAELVIAADCAAVAHPDFHRRFVGGNVVLLGCPKFDGDADYPRRLAELFARSGVRGVTVVRMEVPCCAGLPAAVRQGLAASGRTDLPLREVVVARDGAILDRPSHPGPAPLVRVPA